MWKENDHYAAFIRSLIRDKEIFTLQHFDGEYEDVAECGSVLYTDEWDEPVSVYCFWASEQAALACQKEEWQNYELIRASLTAFISDALINMDQDGIMVGINFSPELIGMEIEPIVLLGDLLDAAEELGETLNLPDYDHILHYRTEWEKHHVGQTHLH